MNGFFFFLFSFFVLFTCLVAEETRRLAEENQATRGKLEQLRMVMEERRARRRARREARVAPYSWTPKSEANSSSSLFQTPTLVPGSLGDCETAAPGASDSNSSMDTSDNSSTAELRELNTEPVVA